MRVTLNDGRSMTGQMLAFDKVRSFENALAKSQLTWFNST
jgi:hypothetical protein